MDGEGRVFLMDAPKAEFRYGGNDHAPQVWVFDAEGRFERAIGQGGALLNPLSLAVARDSVVVFDFSPRSGRAPGRRHHIFATDGRALATHEHPDRVPLPLDLRASAFRGTALGWVAVGRLWAKASPGGGTGPYHDSTLVLSFLPATGEVRTVVSYPSAPKYMSDGGWVASPALSSRPRHAVGGDGRTYLHPGATYVIEVRSHDGMLEKRILGEVDRIRVTEEDYEEAIRLTVRRSRDAFEETNSESELNSMLSAIERNARRAGKADHRPVLGAMWASRDGSILVERLDLAPDPFAGSGRSLWDVIGPDGRVVGRLATPHGLGVQAFEWPDIYAMRFVDGRLEAVRFRIATPQSPCPRTAPRVFDRGEVLEIPDTEAPCRVVAWESGVELLAAEDGSRPDPGFHVQRDGRGRFYWGLYRCLDAAWFYALAG
ncbi:MAG: hypothetical protein OXQ94_17980, partial [Gemmatimonadota bacterium]|nr:hypothetical protein [Gemmatimonadota bacterium]MDE2873567.1 hypothetical protein [Gemmatimonadota bacterium]